MRTEPETAFDGFYRRTWDEVYRAVWVTFRDADLAAEAVDEAMARALARWDQVSGYDNPAGWVYRVAVNWAKTRLRRRQREHSQPVEPALVPEIVPPASEVGEAVRRLPLAQRQVVVLRVYWDWSEADTAAVLGVRPGTVKSRLSRALTRLREELG